MNKLIAWILCGPEGTYYKVFPWLEIAVREGVKDAVLDMGYIHISCLGIRNSHHN